VLHEPAHCIDAIARRQHYAGVRVPHFKKLDDCFWLVSVPDCHCSDPGCSLISWQQGYPVPTLVGYCITRIGAGSHHALARVPPHIKKLDDCFGQFLVRVVSYCGACREIEPEALARLVGGKVTLRELALRVRCSRCGKKAAEVVAVARPRLRGRGSPR
jgi:hypothetical protein